jgi:hypothetical protein
LILDVLSQQYSGRSLIIHKESTIIFKNTDLYRVKDSKMDKQINDVSQLHKCLNHPLLELMEYVLGSLMAEYVTN